MGTWPSDWEERREGANCAICAQGRPAEDEHGVRYWAGEFADAYLQRVTPAAGYSAVLFRGRHVAEPVDLLPDELVGLWRDVAVAAHAIRTVFSPCHLNYQLLGNATPHVHVHVVPRYPDDGFEGRPLGERAWENSSRVVERELAEQVAALERAAAACAELGFTRGGRSGLDLSGDHA